MRLTENRIRKIFEETRRIDVRKTLQQTKYLTDGRFALKPSQKEIELWCGYKPSQVEKEKYGRDLSCHLLDDMFRFNDDELRDVFLEDSPVKPHAVDYSWAVALVAATYATRSGGKRTYYFNRFLVRYALKKFPAGHLYLRHRRELPQLVLIVDGQCVFAIAESYPDLSTIPKPTAEEGQIANGSDLSTSQK